MIYFIRAQPSGNVKIGYTSHAPERRLDTLQVGCFERLTLLGSIEGGMADEKALHERFAAHRLHGEWFSPAEEVTAGIEALLAPPEPEPSRGPHLVYPSEMFGPDLSIYHASIRCYHCGGEVWFVESSVGAKTPVGAKTIGGASLEGGKSLPHAKQVFSGNCGCLWTFCITTHEGGLVSWITVLQECRDDPYRVQPH